MEKVESIFWVPAPIDEVWTFFSNPRNLAAITPKHLHLEIESASDIHDGSTVVINLRPFRLPKTIRWLSKIHDVVSVGNERMFVDIQAAGPMAHWKHSHFFSAGSTQTTNSDGKSVEIANGGTWIRDLVEWKVPFGALGTLVAGSFSRKQINAMFDLRRTEVEKIFKSE